MRSPRSTPLTLVRFTGVPFASLALCAALAFPSVARAQGPCFDSTDTNYPAGVSPNEARIADLDGDGDLDVMVVTPTSLVWLRNVGDGTFVPGATIPTTSTADGFVLADLDGDGDVDAAVVQDPDVVELYVNPGNGVLVAAGSISLGSVGTRVAAGDLDHDGDVDLAVTIPSPHGVAVLLNQGSAVFAAPVFTTLTLFPSLIEMADVSGDGNLDLAVLDLPAPGSGNIGAMLFSFGTGTGAVVPTSYFFTGAATTDFALGDVDGDGDLDVVVCEGVPLGVRVYRNLGGGAFDGSFTLIAVPAGPIACTLVDADADGDLDLVVALTNQVRVLENDGVGVFTLVANPASAVAHSELRADDLDGDGHPDLALLAWNSTQLSVRLNCATNGVPYCFGDGSGTACPCGNPSTPSARSGCVASIGTGARLVSTGVASLANDTVVLRGSGMTNGFALYLQGDAVENGGAGTVLGDGLSCVAGSLVRLGATTNAGGASVYPSGVQLPVALRGAVGVPGTRDYQIWYRNAASYCTPSTFNLSNGLRLTWRP